MKARQKISETGRRAVKAMREAVAEVIREHRRRKLPIAVMRNGKAVFIRVDKPTVKR